MKTMFSKAADGSGVKIKIVYPFSAERDQGAAGL